MEVQENNASPNQDSTPKSTTFPQPVVEEQLPMWDSGTFAAKLVELRRRLRVWHVHDYMAPSQFVQVGSEGYWTIPTITFGYLIAKESDTPPSKSYRLFTCSQTQMKHACVLPNRDNDRVQTLWLLADYHRHLQTAPDLSHMTYLKQVFNQLLDLPAWELGEYEGRDDLIMNGRMIPKGILDDLERVIQALIQTPTALNASLNPPFATTGATHPTVSIEGGGHKTQQDKPPVSENKQQPHPDGVEGGCWLWWKGKRHDVPKGNVYKLIEYFWDRDCADYQALDTQIFDSPVEPQTVRSNLSRVNAALKKISIPWRLKADSEARLVTKLPA